MLASHQGLTTSTPEELILVSPRVLYVRELDKIEAILRQVALLLLFAKLILRGGLWPIYGQNFEVNLGLIYV